MSLNARFRLRIDKGEHIAIGPGKVALLEAILETGSITAAAKRLEMSYRRAWLLVDEMNRSFRAPVVDSAKGGKEGGGTVVTDTGREVISLYRGIEVAAEKATSRELAKLSRLLGA
jgi:molybdate transport system regulatory protein